MQKALLDELFERSRERVALNSRGPAGASREQGIQPRVRLRCASKIHWGCEKRHPAQQAIVLGTVRHRHVFFALFGGKKLPELGAGLGKSIRDFKKAMNGEDEAPASQAKAELTAGMHEVPATQAKPELTPKA